MWATSTTGTLTTAYTSTGKLTFNPSTGTLSATEINSLSDRSLKINIQPISNPLELLQNITGVNFAWKDNGRPSSGLIAQEVEKIIPILVNQIQGYKTVNYNGIIGLLVEAVKKLSDKISELENRK